jgi:hypothetical protein
MFSVRRDDVNAIGVDQLAIARVQRDRQQVELCGEDLSLLPSVLCGAKFVGPLGRIAQIGAQLFDLHGLARHLRGHGREAGVYQRNGKATLVAMF